MYDDFVKEIDNLRCEKEQLNCLVNSCQEEIRQLKKQLEVGKEQYNDLVEEKESLQEQLSSNTLQLEELKKQLEKYKKKLMIATKMEMKEIDKNTFVGIDYFQDKCIIYENQQKEFTEWLENGIETVKNTEFLDERIQRAGLVAYNRALQKYKSIIGGNKDEK